MKLALLGLLLVGCPAARPAAPASGDALVAGAHRVTIDGVDVAYEVRGQGPPCIAHPGGPGFDAGYLHDDALEKHFTMVYVDPVGTGASGRLPATEKYSIARDVGVLDQLRRHIHAAGCACSVTRTAGSWCRAMP